MKAWFIQHFEDIEIGTEIVHALTRGQAIAKSELYRFGCIEFTELRATRLPKMDGKPVTDENAYLAGLMVQCRTCGSWAEGEDGGDPLFDEKGDAYCFGHLPEVIKLV